MLRRLEDLIALIDRVLNSKAVRVLIRIVSSIPVLLCICLYSPTSPRTEVSAQKQSTCSLRSSGKLTLVSFCKPICSSAGSGYHTSDVIGRGMTDIGHVFCERCGMEQDSMEGRIAP